MALSVDSEMASGVAGSASNSTSLTYSFTNTAGTLLVVGVAQSDRTISGVTYNGVAMTQSLSVLSTNGKARSSIYYLLNPATGAHNVVVSLGGGASIVSGAISFTGNHASLPIKTTGQSTGTSGSATTSIASISAGNIIVDCTFSSASFGTTSATRSWLKNLSTTVNGESSRTVATGGVVTITKTVGTSNAWVAVAVEVNSATLPTTSVKRMLALLGCGV